MKVLRQIIALLALLAWLSAGAHVALDHGGKASATQVGGHGHHHHEEAPSPDEEGHHHELGIATTALAKTAQEQLQAPRWLPLRDQLFDELAILLRGTDLPRQQSVLGDSPPDLRMSGWLFVAHTARPVRGPSFAA